MAVLPSTLTDEQPLPQLIVFDLDYTLWPFWVDTHVRPPLQPARDEPGRAVWDRNHESFRFYPDVSRILLTLRDRGVQMAVASRTTAPTVARRMLELLELELEPEPGPEPGPEPEPEPELEVDDSEDKGEEDTTTAATTTTTSTRTKALDVFCNLQIFPGSKKTHFRRLRDACRIPYAQMLFFDDERRNMEVQHDLGVLMHLVPHGLDHAEFDAGVREWRRRCQERVGVRRDLFAGVKS